MQSPDFRTVIGIPCVPLRIDHRFPRRLSHLLKTTTPSGYSKRTKRPAQHQRTQVRFPPLLSISACSYPSPQIGSTLARYYAPGFPEGPSLNLRSSDLLFAGRSGWHLLPLAFRGRLMRLASVGRSRTAGGQSYVAGPSIEYERHGKVC